TLRNVYRETLRLYPPSAFMTRTAQRDVTIDGLDIEAGSLVVVSPWIIHRHRKFWSDPDGFDHERFSDERERAIVPGAYLPFGLGPRICVGRTLSLIEGPLLVAELIRRFSLTVVDPLAAVPTYRLVVRAQRPIRCRIAPIDGRAAQCST